MCKVLSQVYACDHIKPICISSCMRAFRNPTQALPSTLGPPSPTSRTRATSSGSHPSYHHPPSPPPSRARAKSSGAPSYRASSPAASQSRRTSSVSYQPPPPQHRPSYPAPPPPPPRPLDPPDWLLKLPSYNPRRNYCRPWNLQFLPKSQFPCIDCYMRPEWEAYRRRWVQTYVNTHPGVESREEVEELSGLGPQRTGLINVMREMDRMRARKGSRSSGAGEGGESRGGGR